MKIQPFLQPRLTGPRFEDHAIPLEFLKDLAVLDEMVSEVAKWRFLQANPSRKRSRRGFTEGISLGLSAVEQGSAMPLICLFIASNLLIAPENQMYFEEARDAIIGAIGAAEQNKSVTDHLPEKALSYFDRFGRSLRDGEAIEFEAPNRAAPVRLTKETRRRLVLAASNVNELTDELVVHGTIPEADQHERSFELQLLDGRKVRAPMAGQHIDAILEAFNGYAQGLRVRLRGVGRFNRNNRLQSFESIEDISFLDPLDVAVRLDELKLVQNGWLEGVGIAPDHTGLDWLATSFDTYMPEELPLPHVYPTPDGGVRMEWSLETKEASLEIDLKQRISKWHDLDFKTDEEVTADVDLKSEKGWTHFIRLLRRATGGIS